MRKQWQQLTVHEKLDFLQNRMDRAFDLLQSIISDLDATWQGVTASHRRLGEFDRTPTEVSELRSTVAKLTKDVATMKSLWSGRYAKPERVRLVHSAQESGSAQQV